MIGYVSPLPHGIFGPEAKPEKVMEHVKSLSDFDLHQLCGDAQLRGALKHKVGLAQSKARARARSFWFDRPVACERRIWFQLVKTF